MFPASTKMSIYRAAAGLAAILVTLAPRPGLAQDALTLDGAIRETIAHNAGLRAGRAAVASNDAAVSEARAAWFPKLSASETWQRGDQPVFVFSSLLSARRFAAANFAIDALNHPDPIGYFHTSVGAQQMLFDGGQRKAAVDAARRRLDMAQLSVDESTADLVVATVQTYGRVLTAEAAEHAADAALETAEQDRARTEARRDVGMASDADVLALAAHAADLRQRTIQARGDAAVARAELNRLAGAAITRDFRVVEPAFAGADAGDLQRLLAEADASRPELRRVDAAQKLADADRRAARSALVPHVAAEAAFDVSGTAFNDRSSAWTIGGSLQWALSLGGADAARVKAAREESARAAALADDARAAVQTEVVTAFRRREAAVAREAAGRAAVDQARESERIVRDRFDAGLASVTDVLRASSAVLDAEAARRSATVDALTSQAMLDRAVGRAPQPARLP